MISNYDCGHFCVCVNLDMTRDLMVDHDA